MSNVTFRKHTMPDGKEAEVVDIERSPDQTGTYLADEVSINHSDDRGQRIVTYKEAYAREYARFKAKEKEGDQNEEVRDTRPETSSTEVPTDDPTPPADDPGEAHREAADIDHPQQPRPAGEVEPRPAA